MTLLTRKFATRSTLYRAMLCSGFSLAELLLSTSLSCSILFAASSIAVSETKSSIKTYLVQALRNQMASITFLIEGEVAEGESISVCSSGCAIGNTSVAYSITINHPYKATGAGRSSVAISYYGKDDGNLYRLGPPFAAANLSVDTPNGKLNLGSGALDVAASSTETLVSPNTTLRSLSVNAEEGHTLTYSIQISSGTSGRDSAWSSTYSASGVKARTRVLCITRDITVGSYC